MHEDRSNRPMTDAELEIVVGGAADLDMHVLVKMMDRIDDRLDPIRSEFVGLAAHHQAMADAVLGLTNQMVDSLQDGIGGLQGLLDGMTDDQGAVQQGAMSLDQARAGFAGLDVFLERHALGALDRDDSGMIDTGEVGVMIAAAQQELDTMTLRQQELRQQVTKFAGQSIFQSIRSQIESFEARDNAVNQ
ncbi:MAG: hypothetical protein H3C51_00550 [Rubellimicrobium sp.]|nr:hypothetical protein [Rubellimicrobium sp.]